MNLQNSILKTLLYYDIIGKPLSLMEIWQYLINSENDKILCQFVKNPDETPTKEDIENTRLSDIENELTKLIELKKIKVFQGFYFLKSRNNEFIKERLRKEKISQQKIKFLLKKIKFLRYTPFIEGIFLNGSLVFELANKQSDLDLLIITKKDKLYLTRFIISVVALILGIYRTNTKINNKLCLNHYITSNYLYIPFQDLSSAQIHSKLICLWNKGITKHLFKEKTLNKQNELFINAHYSEKLFKNNTWINKYLINFDYRKSRTNYYLKHTFSSDLFRKSFEFILQGFIGNYLEKLVKKYQINLAKKYEIQPEDRIIRDNNQLIFHRQAKNVKIMNIYLKI